jgi:hypothetical protein
MIKGVVARSSRESVALRKRNIVAPQDGVFKAHGRKETNISDSAGEARKCPPGRRRLRSRPMLVTYASSRTLYLFLMPIIRFTLAAAR